MVDKPMLTGDGLTGKDNSTTVMCLWWVSWIEMCSLPWSARK